MKREPFAPPYDNNPDKDFIDINMFDNDRTKK